ncbi:hypothetical protein RYX36_008117, partial [Vicia faba]
STKRTFSSTTLDLHLGTKHVVGWPPTTTKNQPLFSNHIPYSLRTATNLLLRTLNHTTLNLPLLHPVSDTHHHHHRDTLTTETAEKLTIFIRANPFSLSTTVPVVALALPNAATTVFTDSPEPKRQSFDQAEEKKSSMEDSRKLFH